MEENMKLRKVSLILIITVAIMMIASVFSVSYATIDSGYLTIKQLRASGYGYKALEKNIWKICESNSSGTTVNYNHTIYCLKGGPGFGSTNFGSGTPKARPYTKSFNMKNPSSITGSYASAIPSTTSNTYKSLLWLLENVYVAPKSTASTAEREAATEYRNLLLERAGIVGGYITDDDIDAVQQLAVWHFTNNDEYKVENSSEGTFEFWVNAVANSDANYNPLSDEIGAGAINGWDRAEECQALYDYLVETAENMASSYQITTASKPYELANLKATQRTEGSNYIIGPFQINKISNTVGTLTGVFKNGNTTITPTLQDESGNTFSTLKDTIGKKFYISIPTSTTIANITLTISGSYFDTTVTYWSVEGAPNDDQPVVEVNREKETYTQTVTFTPEPEPEKRFDLALRKFITSINGVEPEQSREPQISAQTLKDLADGKIDTAVKTHPKKALPVDKGDKVIYTIRVYNEGEVDGIVKQITDYLPEGLKFVEGSTLNGNNGWTNPSGDKKTYVTDKWAGTTIKAFDGTNLKSLDVQMECEVVATAPQVGKVSLKNIAEITIHSDSKGDTTIKDDDSTPKNLDNTQKENYKPGESEKGWGYEDDDDYEELEVIGKRFDLALRKFITSINGVEPEQSREPQISAQTLKDLADGKIDTAIKTHPKNALPVKTGDKVIYTIRVYNEGEVDGIVKQITDYLPEGLKFVEDSTLNGNNGWTNPSGDKKTYVTDKWAGTTIKAFDGTNLKSLDVQMECEVVATVQSSDNVLKNIAEITIHSDSTGDTTVKDDDSDPNNVDKDNYGTTNQEDDDDFEQLVINGKYFDLSLRKFITAVGENELKDEEGKYIREPDVDVTPLLNGEKTAIYKHNKKPVNVDVGDIVTYTIRVYNEGEVDGYVNEITDHLPQWLEFIIDDELNASYGWRVSSDGRTVTTDITSKNTEYSASRDTIYANRTEKDDKVLLKAFNTQTKKLDYIDVKIRCKVKDTGIAEKITNIAEITKSSDSNGNEILDRDGNESKPDNVTLPTDETLPEYKDDEINRGDEYIPGQEDDDDFEKVIVQKFDLSLRKFITGVNDKEISSRIPVFSMSSDGKFTYTHPKTPVEVVNGDIIIYTIRVYNEGNQAGYAEEVKDNLPEGLVYLPDNELNKTYRWKMYKEDGTETTNVKEAKTIRTDYLSKAQETETGRDNLIEAFNKNTMTQPDHKDVKIAFKVTEPNTSDRVLINTAEIAEDSDEKGNPVDDIDSTPDNDKDGEDDIDIEKVKVKYFDLSLEKIITEYSLTKNGKTTKTKTGHKFGVHPEPVVKVELIPQTMKTGILKFKYQIKVTNEGEIAGYATEVKDYIPKGLKFVQKDNPKWKLSKDGKTVTTDQLKNKLLKPGESAVVEITLQWINGQNNLGLKQNWAEISKDKNDSDTPDIDSTPNNNKKGEDDIDDAPAIISVVTGIGENYVIITGAVLSILSAGIVLIKKFVI